MAQFRLSAAIVSRSAGKSVVAAAAYRAAQKLLDERTGDIKDYTRRGGVLHTEILTPENAPQWMLDRQRLWNEVERREDQSTRPNQAQLARDIELSLPFELTHKQRVELVREFVKTEFVDRGMVADIAIHAPPKRGDGANHHAHILLTMRDVEDGGFGAKNRAWNRKADIELWRERWADCQNRALEKYGFEARVDHRSLEDQGIDREPTTHLGPGAQALEDRGIATDRGDQNRERLAANDNREKLKAELADIDRQIAALERIQKIVAAVEKGYERAGQGAQIQGTQEPQSSEMEILRQQPYAGAPEAPAMPDSESPADKIAADAQAKEQERQDQARKDQETQQEQARSAEEKRLAESGRQHREEQEARREQARLAEEKRIEERGAQHRDRQIQLAEEFRGEQERIDALEKAPQRIDTHLLELERTTEGHRQTFIDRDEKKYLEGDIRDPGARYAQALTRHYTYIDPYESLAKVALAEHAAFRTEQQTLAGGIAKATDPKERELLQTRKLIEAYDYLMITGERIAKMSELVSGELVNGRLVSKESIRMREQIDGKDIRNDKGEKTGFEDGYKQKAQKLRQHYRELQAGRAAPTKERAQPQSALDKIVADARRQTLAPGSRETGPNRYKDLADDPQKKKDQEKQQELERKAQKDRERER